MLRQAVLAANAAIAELDPQIASAQDWRRYLRKWRKKLGDELLALPPRDPRQHGYRLSITRIDRGLDFVNELLPARLPLDDLMAADGFVPHDAHTRARGDAWFGTMPEVEHRIAFLQKKRDEVQARLDGIARLPDLEEVPA